MQTSLIAACFLTLGAVLPSPTGSTLSPAEVCLFLPRTPLLSPGPQEPPPPPKTRPEAKQDEGAKKAKSDARALAHLDKAIARQGGAELAKGVTRLHLLFAKAIGHKAGDHPDADAQGSFEVDRGGLTIDWMAPNYLRSKIVIDGKAKVRGQFEKFGKATAWLDDGKSVTPLAGDKYAKDREQIDDQLELIEALLDVAVLRRMKTDGSVWTVAPPVESDPADVVRLQRIPPTTEDGKTSKLRLIIEFSTKTYDPTRMVVLPRAPNDPLLSVSLTYNDTYPTIKGGGDVRFPFKVDVHEKTSLKGPYEPVLELAVQEVAFNAASNLDEASFKQPKRGK